MTFLLGPQSQVFSSQNIFLIWVNAEAPTNPAIVQYSSIPSILQSIFPRHASCNGVLQICSYVHHMCLWWWLQQLTSKTGSTHCLRETCEPSEPSAGAVGPNELRQVVIAQIRHLRHDFDNVYNHLRIENNVYNIWTAQGGGGSFQPKWTCRKKIWNSIGSKVNGLHIQLFCFELTNWVTDWLTNWLSELTWLTDWLTDWPTD